MAADKEKGRFDSHIMTKLCLLLAILVICFTTYWYNDLVWEMRRFERETRWLDAEMKRAIRYLNDKIDETSKRTIDELNRIIEQLTAAGSLREMYARKN